MSNRFNLGVNYMSDHSTQQLIPFNFESKQIRIVTDEQGNPWFVAKDIFEVLGITWNGLDSLLAIKDSWKRVWNFHTEKGLRNIIVINEPAVYKLAFRSNKETAEVFTDWIAGEVIPSIRKTGSYTLGQEKAIEQKPTPSLSTEMTADVELYSRMGKLLGYRENQLTHHVNHGIRTRHGRDLLAEMGVEERLLAEVQVKYQSVTELGRPRGLSPQKVNQLLEAAGMQTCYRDYNNSRKWTPTAKGQPYARLADTVDDRGYMHQHWYWLESCVVLLGLSS